MRVIAVVLVSAYVAFVIVMAFHVEKKASREHLRYCMCPPGQQYDCPGGYYWPCKDVLAERQA